MPLALSWPGCELFLAPRCSLTREIPSMAISANIIRILPSLPIQLWMTHGRRLFSYIYYSSTTLPVRRIWPLRNSPSLCFSFLVTLTARSTTVKFGTSYSPLSSQENLALGLGILSLPEIVSFQTHPKLADIIRRPCPEAGADHRCQA